MARLEPVDFFVSTEEVEIDDETTGAIQRGIEDADAGRVVTIEEARKRMEQWLSKSSSPTRL
jgi:predicted transcriptional regulator